jgi:propionyl-CoA synthetase
VLAFDAAEAAAVLGGADDRTELGGWPALVRLAGSGRGRRFVEEEVLRSLEPSERDVLGVADKLKGQVPIGFLVLNAGVDRDHEEIKAEVVKMVRERIGPVAAFKTATVVNRLPKTRSGKILRGTIQKIADNVDYKVPATIDDPAILGEMETALTGIGYGSARNN